MLDNALRRYMEPPLDVVARWSADRGVSPMMVTGIGFTIGMGACVAAATQQWTLALVLWLLNRFADGLDGSIARRRGPTDLGGFLDIMADFTVYGAMLLAIGFAVPEARLAALAVLLMYYISGSAFLAWSSLATKNGIVGDGRSLVFPAGLAEGAETVVAYIVVLLFLSRVTEILWIWAIAVGITAVQRVLYVARVLREIEPARITRSIPDAP